ncbi:MAG: hypothetical protein ABIA12_03045 [Candidatus Aenigmatarchaeota archaeon]
MSVAAERRLYSELNELGIKPYDVSKIEVAGEELICHLSNGMLFKSDSPYLVELAAESKLRTAGENHQLKHLYGLAVAYGGEERPFSVFAENMASSNPRKRLNLERELEKRLGAIPYDTMLADKLYAELSKNLTYTVPFSDLGGMSTENKLNMLAFMSEERKIGSMAPFMR